MRRREFLASALAAAPFLSARKVAAQGRDPNARAAVVIGVNATGNLPILNAAVSGAKEVATWLKGEGFGVKEHIDDNQAVTVVDIFDSVNQLVSLGTLEQLVIYFSGHGFLNSFDEIWMLSGAPSNPNEAISLRESIVLARETAIPNVVFISDACRSTSASLGAQRVRGGLIFPNPERSARLRPEVDRFLAALPGNTAAEIPVQHSVERFKGIYTTAFLDAFRHPDDTMIHNLNNQKVIPNRSLKAYLGREVPQRAQAASIRLHQEPDSIIESGTATFIGRAQLSAVVDGSTPTTTNNSTVLDLASAELANIGLNTFESTSTPVNSAVFDAVKRKTGFDVKLQKILKANAPSSFETHTGFAINGANVREAFVTDNTALDVFSVGDGTDAQDVIRLSGDQPTSLIIRFSDDSGSVVAALPGYIGTVVVDDTGVASVTYHPSENTSRWHDYLHNQDRLVELRAYVATAARLGVFRIEGNRENRMRRSEELADRIRILKAIDPTLGLYAAYAYTEADVLGQVRSVRDFMNSDLNTDLFDVAMLSGGLSPSNYELRSSSSSFVPFCPLLAQGWGLLRVRNIKLLPVIEQMKEHMRPALWTTFDREGMSRLLDSFHSGQLE